MYVSCTLLLLHIYLICAIKYYLLTDLLSVIKIDIVQDVAVQVRETTTYSRGDRSLRRHSARTVRL